MTGTGKGSEFISRAEVARLIDKARLKVMEDMGAALGQILDEQEDDFDKRLARLDGASLIRTVAGNQVTSNVNAAQVYFDTILHRRCELKANPETHVPELVKAFVDRSAKAVGGNQGNQGGAD